MAAFSKTVNTSLLAITDIANNAVSVSTVLSLTTGIGAMLFMRMGRTSSSAFTTNGLVFRVEVAYNSSGTDNWLPLAQFETQLGSSIGSQAVSGTEVAGQTVVTLAAGTNFAARDYVFFHNTTIGNSEWSRVLSVSGADLTLEEGITNAQTGATCRDQAEAFLCAIPGDMGITRVRVVVVNNTGQTAAAQVIAATTDSIA